VKKYLFQNIIIGLNIGWLSNDQQLLQVVKNIIKLKMNQSAFVPKDTIYRVENRQNTPLEIIEVQTGDYLGEDDIIRIEYDYDRN